MFYLLQVLKEHSSYRQKLMDHSRRTFLRYYADAMGLNNVSIESQVDYIKHVKDNVEILVGRTSSFHFGKDALVSTFLFLNSGLHC